MQINKGDMKTEQQQVLYYWHVRVQRWKQWAEAATDKEWILARNLWMGERFTYHLGLNPGSLISYFSFYKCEIVNKSLFQANNLQYFATIVIRQIFNTFISFYCEVSFNACIKHVIFLFSYLLPVLRIDFHICY